ncbi:lytic transglycosylase domain-containing protein [Acidocella sp.]|uniref:lytic murein transglycosylase n=1 Tax=Acidocella sp. TaxID=50710 RepID=UPI002614D066|nr:lytic murein transglycosylase [Acidocella sp.]
MAAPLRRYGAPWHKYTMLRRKLILGLALTPLLPRAARATDYEAFLHRLHARALAAGIPESVATQALSPLTVPNAAVLKLDQHQPEFTETYATYATHVLNATRIANGRSQYGAAQSLFASITSRWGVATGPMLGIWGLETNFGANQGDFYVIDALATLAWDRESSYFAKEAIAAMRIIAAGDAPVGAITGSYAGAMGQPQFMPSVYLSTAISFSGNGAPDIWHSDADALASMANYLMKAGWQAGEPSSEQVLCNFSSADGTGRQNMRTLGYWRSRGVQRLPGAMPLPDDFPAALLLPDGPSGPAFLAYRNFTVIRRYNPSDYYALATAALGRAILA